MKILNKITYTATWVHLDRSDFKIFIPTKGWKDVSFDSDLLLGFVYHFWLDPLNPHIERKEYFYTLEYGNNPSWTRCQMLETELEIAQAISKSICYQTEESSN